MNTYVADQIAREHTDRLLSDAAAARRARRARRSRRAATATRKETHDATAAGRSRSAARAGTVTAAHLIALPFTAFRSWLLAGQL